MASLASSTAAVAAAPSVAPQGGVIEGVNPAKYDPKQPVVLFIIQVCPVSIPWPKAALEVSDKLCSCCYIGWKLHLEI